MKALRIGMLAACIGATVMMMGASGGCGTALHKATITSGTIAATLNTAATTNHNNTLETPEERAEIAKYIDAAAKSNDTFLGVLSAANSNGGVVDSTALLNAFQDLTAKIGAFQAEGVLHIKDPNAQAYFSVAIDTLQAALNAIASYYPATAASNHVPHSRKPKPSKYPLALASVVFTPAEIEEMLALAIAAGSALVTKLLQLRGATDPQIISTALADDAAAEKLSEEDIAAEGEAAPGAQTNTH